MQNLSQIVDQLVARRKVVKSELERLEAAIGALRGESANGPGKMQLAKPIRVMSPAARRKIANAQKARWAAWRAKQKKAA